MKKIYIVILCLLSHQLLVHATMQERFLQGYQAYEHGQYEVALQKYQSIKNPGPAVWYNIGNCFFALGNDLNALACWRRAQNSMDNGIHKEAEKNIHVIRERYHTEPNRNFFNRVITRLSAISMYGSLLFWQMIFFIFLTFGILLIPYLIVKKYIISLILCMMMLVVIGSIPWIKYTKLNQQYAVVSADSSLFIGPDDRFSQCGSVRKFQEIRVLEKKDNWNKISQDNAFGWIPVENLIII